MDKNDKDILGIVIRYLDDLTDLQRTYHNCQMHSDSDACQYIDKKRDNVMEQRSMLDKLGIKTTE